MSIKAAFIEASNLAEEFLCARSWEDVVEWKASSQPTIMLMYDEQTNEFIAACVDEENWLEPFCTMPDPEGAVQGLVDIMRAYIAEQRADFGQFQEDNAR